jgi:Exopolyphosphatase-related proteins
MNASSSIYTEYILHKLTPLINDQETTRITTTLLFDIQTDTNDFTLTTNTNFTTAAYMRPFYNNNMLKHINHNIITTSTMNLLNRTLSNILIIHNFTITNINQISSNDRDTIATTTNFILQHKNLNTILVYNIINDHIDDSLRTNNANLKPTTFLQTILGIIFERRVRTTCCTISQSASLLSYSAMILSGIWKLFLLE